MEKDAGWASVGKALRLAATKSIWRSSSEPVGIFDAGGAPRRSRDRRLCGFHNEPFARMTPLRTLRRDDKSQDEQYLRAIRNVGNALKRLAQAFEANPDLQLDLLQDIHFAIWRSFAQFDGRCTEYTWVFRVAHNVAASHVLRRKRARVAGMVTLEELANRPDESQPDPELMANDRQAEDRLASLVRALDPPDRQVVVLYLEGLDSAAIGEICGLSPGAVSTKIHRLKAALTRRFNQAQGRTP